MSAGADAARRDEALVEIAQEIVRGHHHLLASYGGGERRTQAQRDISSSCHYSGGAGYHVQVKGKNVEFVWSGIEGKARIADLLKIVADHGTPAKYNRLRHHALAWVAAHAARDRFEGPGRAKERRKSPRYAELSEVADRAQRAMREAADRWWEIENATKASLWWAALDAVRFAADAEAVERAEAFYAFVWSAEHEALAALQVEALTAAAVAKESAA